MNVVLMGTPEFVVPIFESVSAKHNVMAVFTRGPKPVGRKHIMTKSPVHVWAESHGFPVFHKTSDYNFSPDMVIVVAYGAILRENVLNSAPCINLHPSLLPCYRGPSPIKTAIINGDSESGVCLMQVAPELDAGDVYMCRKFEIGIDDTNADIESRVSKIGAEMLDDYMSNMDLYPPIPQRGNPTYTRKFVGTDEIINWSNSALQIHNQIRALGAGRTKINGIDVKILATKLNGDKLEIVKIQPAGKNPMDWKSFINGLHNDQIEFGR